MIERESERDKEKLSMDVKSV